jgi:hypothetical protein
VADRVNVSDPCFEDVRMDTTCGTCEAGDDESGERINEDREETL